MKRAENIKHFNPKKKPVLSGVSVTNEVYSVFGELRMVKICSEKPFARIIETLHNFDPDGQLGILTCSEMAPKMSLFGLSNS